MPLPIPTGTMRSERALSVLSQVVRIVPPEPLQVPVLDGYYDIVVSKNTDGKG